MYWILHTLIPNLPICRWYHYQITVKFYSYHTPNWNSPFSYEGVWCAFFVIDYYCLLNKLFCCNEENTCLKKIDTQKIIVTDMVSSPTSEITADTIVGIKHCQQSLKSHLPKFEFKRCIHEKDLNVIPINQQKRHPVDRLQQYVQNLYITLVITV